MLYETMEGTARSGIRKQRAVRSLSNQKRVPPQRHFMQDMGTNNRSPMTKKGSWYLQICNVEVNQLRRNIIIDGIVNLEALDQLTLIIWYDLVGLTIFD